jgi:glutaredoxin
MSSDKELVVYTRTKSCPYWSMARRALEKHRLPYRTILVDEDEAARQRVIEWTGFEAVPTIVVARRGEDLPYEPPEPLEADQSPRGLDRGSMITEANTHRLEKWLRRHGFIE